MKKKIKKISKEQELRNINEALKDNIIGREKAYQRIKSILEQTIAVIEGGSHYDRMIAENLPLEVMKLKLYKNQNEGAQHIFADVVTNQREIIRWLINPDTTDQSEEIKKLTDPNFGRRPY